MKRKRARNLDSWLNAENDAILVWIIIQTLPCGATTDTYRTCGLSTCRAENTASLTLFIFLNMFFFDELQEWDMIPRKYFIDYVRLEVWVDDFCCF